MMTTCDDCGRAILLRRRTSTGASCWAHQFGRSWIFTCRATVEGGRLIAADYHHPAGEAQRHWPADPLPEVDG